MTEMQAADEGSKMQKLEEKDRDTRDIRDRELEDVRQLQREAESNRKAADARAEELHRRLEEAERRALEAAAAAKSFFGCGSGRRSEQFAEANADCRGKSRQNGITSKSIQREISCCRSVLE